MQQLARQDLLLVTDNVPTLGTAWSDFKRLRPLKQKTMEDYDKRLKQLDDWMDLPIDKITRNMVVERFDSIRQRSESHANLIMKVLSSVLSYASARYEYSDGQPMLAANPVKVLKGLRLWNRVSRRQTIINTCDLAKWWQAVQALDKQGHSLGRDVLVVLLLTGMRKAEASRLRWGDIDFSNGSILIRDTKNGTDHQIPMGAYLKDFLWNRHLAQRHNNAACEYVFPGKDLIGHVKSIENAIDRVIAQSGMAFCIHDTRRTFATQGMLAGVPAYMLKRILNHRVAADVTNGYLVFGVDDMRESMQKIEDQILKHALTDQPICGPIRDLGGGITISIAECYQHLN